MTSSDLLEPLLEPVTAVQRLIDHFDQRGIITGGRMKLELGTYDMPFQLNCLQRGRYRPGA